MNGFKKYLPSKKFISVILVVVVFTLMFFVVKGIIYLFKNTSLSSLIPANKIVVGDLIQKDSNNNGIPDWEEYLWGLDPTKNGPENKEFILAKKKELSPNSDSSALDDSKSITDNEMLSREFFATIVSLQQTGNIDDSSLQSVSDAIGQQIKATPLPDIYTKNMMTIIPDSKKANMNYSVAFMGLIAKHANDDIGSELSLVSQGVANNDQAALDSAETVAVAYKSFGSELIKIPVPNSLYSLGLDIANNYEKTGESIDGLSKTVADPLTGMKSLINYKNYSTALASDINKLSGLLMQK